MTRVNLHRCLVIALVTFILGLAGSCTILGYLYR
jgi:hypothetical protein